MTKEIMDAQNKEMESTKPVTLVDTCIDFRKVKQTLKLLKENYGLEPGLYHLLSTAGAGRNSEMEERVEKPHGTQVGTWINLPHKDCGYAKSLGDDTEETHKKFEDDLGTSIKGQNPNINYHSHLLPLEEGDLEKHTCLATAIILGEPKIVEQAVQELEEQGLDGNYDIIARPFLLSPQDESIWDDLEISLKLHHPQKILIFDKDEANARMLVEKASTIAKDTEVEPKVIPLAA